MKYRIVDKMLVVIVGSMTAVLFWLGLLYQYAGQFRIAGGIYCITMAYMITCMLLYQKMIQQRTALIDQQLEYLERKIHRHFGD